MCSSFRFLPKIFFFFLFFTSPSTPSFFLERGVPSHSLAHLLHSYYFFLSLSLSLASIHSFIHSLSLSRALPSAHMSLIACHYSLSSIFTRCFFFTFQNPTCFSFFLRKKKKKRKTLIYYLLNYFLRLFPTSPSLFSFSSSANLLSPGEGRKEKKKDKTGGCDPTSQCPA